MEYPLFYELGCHTFAFIFTYSDRKRRGLVKGTSQGQMGEAGRKRKVRCKFEQGLARKDPRRSWDKAR
jgi:hypothetical protein